MSNFVKDSIQETLKATSYKMDEMSALESVFFRKKVLEKFTAGKDHRALWEVTKASEFAVRDSNACDWLDEFLQLDECYIFFDKGDDTTIYIFPENQSISKFLSEFPGYVFYLTNESLDYLICFNDSDYLIALGTAEPWLRDKAKELSKSGWVDMDGKNYL